MVKMLRKNLILLFCLIINNCEISLQYIFNFNSKLLLITFATEETDGYLRYLRSTQVYGLETKVLGLDTPWLGGDLNGLGGGHKINLLRQEISEIHDEKIILFSDSYDVILLGTEEKILTAYEELGGGIIFGAESYCWPNESLKVQYPEVDKRESRFLNSGSFIGPADLISKMLTFFPPPDNKDDDQLYYTKIFLDQNLRKKFKLRLDSKSQLFQNLHGADDNVELKMGEFEAYVFNTFSESSPLLLHGNGLSKNLLNYFGNYVAQSWDPLNSICNSCWEENLSFEELIKTPQILMAIFIKKQTPFLAKFLKNIENLDYPKFSIDIVVYCASDVHTDTIQFFLERNKNVFNSIHMIGKHVNQWHAREHALDRCKRSKCDYYFNVDAEAHLTNPLSLKLLIEQNRKIVAPLLVHPYQAWSNFWGALSPDGFYARSDDYMAIINDERVGLWNVPFISTAYLIKASIISQLFYTNSGQPTSDGYMTFCENLRRAGTFMYLTNRDYFGHLINSDSDETTQPQRLHIDLWQIKNNRLDWEEKYLHPNYSIVLNSLISDVLQPCPDVFWFPILTDLFVEQFVAEAENYGQWSDGSNQDSRLDGGYENVPTRDIHMKQLGFHDEWLYFLDTYVRPLQEKVFSGYYENPPRALMNFIVRYRPDEQPSLRPHHDSSTFTINIALNSDFEGGGCNFIRYNCSVVQTRPGWMLMHPGRLTHYHEGLRVTRGTRYIMVSFVDP